MADKLLVSWLAFASDFVRTDEGMTVNPDGPTVSFHRQFFAHSRHILLSAEAADDPRLVFLQNYLERELGHTVMPQYLHVHDLLDLQEIKTKIETLLLAHRGEEIDIFFSPGNSIMQLAWYICHTTLGLNTRLIQTRKASDTPDGQDERIILQVGPKDSVPRSLIIQQLSSREKPILPHKLTPSLQPIYDRALLVAQTDKVSVLIEGASGTGKEHLARYIHQHSHRGKRKLRTINCAAFSDELLGSALFGHVRGAFTGADQSRKGWFEEASGSTLFLDEIGDISPFMQQSLLRALQEGEINPLGTNEIRKVEVRIIAATNQNLRQKCESGEFRWDLYYRLAEVSLRLPRLEERGVSEKMALFEHFLQVYREVFAKPALLYLTPEVRKLLEVYPFPGNIREMESLVKQLYVFCEHTVRKEDLPLHIQEIAEGLGLHISQVEKEHIIRVLKVFEGNLAQTHEAIGWARNTLTEKMKKYGIDKAAFRSS